MLAARVRRDLGETCGLETTDRLERRLSPCTARFDCRAVIVRGRLIERNAPDGMPAQSESHAKK
jgi:hypothetical protein